MKLKLLFKAGIVPVVSILIWQIYDFHSHFLPFIAGAIMVYIICEEKWVNDK